MDGQIVVSGANNHWRIWVYLPVSFCNQFSPYEGLEVLGKPLCAEWGRSTVLDGRDYLSLNVTHTGPESEVQGRVEEIERYIKGAIDYLRNLKKYSISIRLNV